MNEVDPEGGFVRTNALMSSDAVIVNDCATERSRVTSLAEIDGDETACAFYDIATKNKYFKRLKAENFVETNFNKNIEL